ncbi:hypothetical protein BIV25_44165 [Streptomyces sp. MUSC 14]|uniref:hypothetical protein n=1 Tax=Streptomyces sp. MUSC 14 TaxID=1354889 RepID=UPI0008F579F3|nr:hypothetical protein [Streptomyces sp. MUSC 14]OIJ85370.1 hypothetical protein BIV25_44165 [Streptomyces sp. MUSC 14]
MLRSAEDLQGLPVRQHEHVPACAPEFLSVSAGLQFSIAGRRHSALGFGCSRRAERARHSALWETYERLLMVAELSGSLGRPVQGHDKDGTPTATRAFEHVVARPWHDTYRPGQDATGLAVHTTASAAQRAAERELLERALLAAIWYGSAPLHSEVTEHPCVTTGRLRTYSFPCRLGFFCLAAWHDPHSQIFVTGSAVRDSLHDAIEHALGEAVMVFDGVWQGKTPRYSTQASRDRYASLRGDLHAARAEHVESRLTAQGDDAGAPSDAYGDSLAFYRLIDWEGVCLVRAVADRRETTSTIRARNWGLPPDPFT